MKIQSAKAGIGTGRAGLQAASGLFSSAGLFDKGVKSFNPLDLNPYLLFDAQTSMIGTLENPTLDLDPSKQDTLDVITATRAGVATFTDANGNIATAPANTVRVDYVDSVPMILVEPSSENLITYSEDFSGSSWNDASASVAVDYGYLSPKGDLTASKVTKQNTNGHLYGGSGTTGAKSIFIKGTAGETVASLDRHSDSNTLITLTGEWQRLELNGVNAIFYAVDFRAGTATEVYLWGAQLETGSVATSYIPTAGGDAAARTRAADNLVISGSAFSSFYNQSEGTIYCEVIPRETNKSVYSLDSGNFSNRIFYGYESDSRPAFRITTNGAPQAALRGTATNLNELIRAAGSYKANNFKFSSNGGSELTDTSGSLPTLNRLTIGATYDFAGLYILNGHLKRLVYWPVSSDLL